MYIEYLFPHLFSIDGTAPSISFIRKETTDTNCAMDGGQVTIGQTNRTRGTYPKS